MNTPTRVRLRDALALADRIRVRPHRDRLPRVQAGIGDRRVTSWPEYREVTVAEILDEFADLAAEMGAEDRNPLDLLPSEVAQDVADHLMAARNEAERAVGEDDPLGLARAEALEDAVQIAQARAAFWRGAGS